MDFAEIDRSLERTLGSVANTIWRRRGVFVVVSAPCFAALIIGILSLTPIYEASVRVLSGQAGMQTAGEDTHKAGDESASLSEIAQSEVVLRQAVAAVGLGHLVGTTQAVPRPRLQQLHDWLTGRLSGGGTLRPVAAPPVDSWLPHIAAGLTVRAQPNSDVIVIGFRNKDPVAAADFVNAVAAAFVDRQIVLSSQPGAAAFFTGERATFESQLRDASDALKAFSLATNTYSIDDQRELLLKRLNDIAAQSSATRGMIFQKLGERKALADELHRLAPVAQSSYVSSLVDALSAGGSAAGGGRSGGGDTELQNRNADPPLLLIKVYQDSMTALFQLNAGLYGSQELLREQNEEVAKLTTELNTLATNEREFLRLTRAVSQAAYNADSFAKRAMEEQITAQLNAAKFSSLKILQPATQPLQPAFPKYPLMLAAAAVFSSILGAVAALAREALRRPELHRSALLPSRSGW